ncbi:hypothetical protein [Arthrobacter sp. QXT-31]|uniref:hypothetical protein n=1 Tax=Arthrobacter sp. QXT-31 TaxID=1357915 RepID=UPI000971B498|nr:hypothetical protein [Arthrobacter sp. QXT-31]APX01396.1 hypothetical protein BWQ92_06370 [Arthrobacter sp. QXT-31]
MLRRFCSFRCCSPVASSPYEGAGAATTATAATNGYARLDEAGIAQIKASKSARLDMTSGQLTKESVGLESGTSQAPDVLMRDGMMELIIEGPTGTVRAHTDRLRFNGMNNGPDFSQVTYFLTARSLEDFTALLRDGVDRYGIPGESAERWIESISSRPEDKGDFALEPGTSTGLDVIYDLRYDGTKDVQVIIVHVTRLTGSDPKLQQAQTRTVTHLFEDE